MQKSRQIPTVNDLSDPKYQDFEYQGLLELCSKQEIKLSDDEITQIEKDTRTQSSRGPNFLKHRAVEEFELLKASKHLIQTLHCLLSL